MSNPIALVDHRAYVYVGDTLSWLRRMSSDSVDCVVTSPPYWGLRDYGTAFWVEGDPRCDHVVGADATRTPWANRIKGPNGGRTIAGFRDQQPARSIGGTCLRCGAIRADYQIGLEPTLGQHIDVIVEIFAEIWRVLKPTGSVWLNYGDCYATAPNGRSAAATRAAGQDDRSFRDKPFSTVGPIYEEGHSRRHDPKRRVGEAGFQRDSSDGRGVFEGTDWGSSGAGTRRIDHGGRVVAGGVLKDKDLCMLANRIAIALQEWGWWVRSEIVWGKKNPMPDSSGRGRPSVAHEKIWLLTKSADADVWYARDSGDVSFHPDLSERVPLVTRPDREGPRWIRLGSYYDAGAVMQASSPQSHARMAQDVAAQKGGTRADRPMKAVASKISGGQRNNASMDAALKTYTVGGHRRSQNVGGDPRLAGHVNHTGMSALGRGHGRLLRNYEPAPDDAPDGAPLPVWPIGSHAYKDAHYATFPPELAERCILAGCPPNGLVLDPFGGSGTVALVALRHGRRCDLIELKPDHVEQARRRIEMDWMGEDERRRARAKRAAAGKSADPGPLFRREAAE